MLYLFFFPQFAFVSFYFSFDIKYLDLFFVIASSSWSFSDETWPKIDLFLELTVYALLKAIYIYIYIYVCVCLCVTCGTLLEKQGRAHKWCTPMDPHIWPGKSRLTCLLKHTYSSYVRIRDVALKTWQKRWTIGRSGERGSRMSVLAARHDDDDDIYISILF